MRAITTWYADDDTVFHSEEECRKYEEEQELNKLQKSILLWDERGNSIPFSEFNYDRAYYLKIITEEAAIKLNAIMEARGYTLPWESAFKKPSSGIWFWDNNSTDWMDIAENYENWKQRLKVVMGVREI